MSFKAELTVDGKTYLVRRFYTEIIRYMDSRGRPSSPTGWSIFLRIDAVDDTTLTGWMIDNEKRFDGKLTIYKMGQDAKLKDIKFKNCFCFGLYDIFQPEVSYAVCEIQISGEEIEINNASLKQNWPQ